MPKCSSDGKLITVVDALTQNNVTMYSPQGELNIDQSWYFEDTSISPSVVIESGATYQFRARHSGRYIAVDGTGTSDGTYLEQYAQGYTANQKFIVTARDDGYYTFSPATAPDKLVNVTSTDTGYNCTYIEIRDIDTTNNQNIPDTVLFKFTYDSQKCAYKIEPKSNPDTKCFAVAFSNYKDNASVVCADTGSSDNRYFVIERVSESITSSISYQNNGNYPRIVTDSRGNTTTYTFDTARGTQTGVTDAKNQTTNYSYNTDNDRLNSVTSGNSTVSYDYDNVGMLGSITSPSGTEYYLVYDDFGNLYSTSVGSRLLSENTYNINQGTEIVLTDELKVENGKLKILRTRNNI